jgi:uncharacterized protein (DUF1810 family)
MPMHADDDDDEPELDRFLTAQAGGVYETALGELRRGCKRSHWMWFVFPQLAGLGRSETARFYGIRGLAEARAYLDHPLLGPRLEACCQALLDHDGRTALEILGAPDDMKLRSSMTLFQASQHSDSIFGKVLDHYFASEPDPLTIRILGL